MNGGRGENGRSFRLWCRNINGESIRVGEIIDSGTVVPKVSSFL
jgi:hypothetical protein